MKTFNEKEEKLNSSLQKLKKLKFENPQLAEQLDMLYHDMTAGKGDKTGDWYTAIAKVKSDNPKP